MRGDSGVAGEGRVVGVPKFHSWGLVHHAINEYQLSLDVQRFLWPVYYIILPGSFISGCNWRCNKSKLRSLVKCFKVSGMQ